MNIAVARPPSKKYISIERPVITNDDMIIRIKNALDVYAAAKSDLPNDNVGQTLERIANYFKQVVEAKDLAGEDSTIEVFASMKPAKNELSGLFGKKAIAENPAAAQIHSTFTATLKGTAYDIT